MSLGPSAWPLVAGWHRRRRHHRAFDAAGALVPHLRGARRVLDVGCGDGLVAYHVGAMLGAEVVGADVGPQTHAPIAYRELDDSGLPFRDESFDGLMLGFVLHHAADPAGLLRECRRVLAPGGVMVVHEDAPEAWHDQLLCLVHHVFWRKRTGPCTFQQVGAWRGLFAILGLEIAELAQLPRTRDITHPVRSYRFVLRRP